MKEVAWPYGIELQEELLSDALEFMVRRLYEKHGLVVVLVDEDDKAMMDVLAQSLKNPGKSRHPPQTLRHP
jgi:hypothetical protein